MQVTISDDSDKGGLKEGQSVKINGKRGVFVVAKVFGTNEDGSRSYDMVREAGNRAERRRRAALRRKV